MPSAANVLTYVAIVRERYFARALMTAAQDIIKDINDNALDSGRYCWTAPSSVFLKYGREGKSADLTHIKSVIENETYDRLSKMADPATRARLYRNTLLV